MSRQTKMRHCPSCEVVTLDYSGPDHRHGRCAKVTVPMPDGREAVDDASDDQTLKPQPRKLPRRDVPRDPRKVRLPHGRQQKPM